MKTTTPGSKRSRRRPCRLAASAAAFVAALLLTTATTAQAAPELPSGAVAYWSFDDTLADPVGASTLTTAAGTLAYGLGNFGSASLYCNGSTYLKTASNALPTGMPTGASPYTVAAWIKCDTGCPGGGTWIAYGTPNGSQANTFRLNGGNNPWWNDVWNYWWGNDFGGALASGNFFDGWHSVVGTWDGTTERLYLDGVPRAARNPGPPNIQGTSFLVGRALFDGDYWKGWIDDVLIMNRAMSQDEAIAYHTYGALSVGTPVAIVASVSGSGGTISPGGTVPVMIGTSKTFTITPAFGYRVSDVSVTENGATTSKGGVTTYAFNDVQAAGSITVTFASLAVVGVGGTVRVDGGGTGGDATVGVYSDPARTALLTAVSADSSGVYEVSLPQNATYYLQATKSGFAPSAVLTAVVGTSGQIGRDLVFTSRRYEAENPANTFVHCVTPVEAHPNVSGGACAGKDTPDQSGGFTVNNVTASETGLYAMTVSDGGYADRPSGVKVNGTDLSGYPFRPATWNGAGQGTFTCTVALKAGANTITIYAPAGEWGPHWDCLDVAIVRVGPANKITSSAGTGGSISPLGDIYMAPGASQTFTITPDRYYQVTSVLANGAEVVAGPGTQTYTMVNVADTDMIVASFEALTTHTITASAGTGGSISPAGTVVVVEGADQTFTIAASYGYSLAEVVVDTVSQGPMASYTFPNVTTHHTISASFTDLGGAKLPIGAVAYWHFDNALTDPAGGNTLAAKAGTVAYGPAKFGSACLQLDGSTWLGRQDAPAFPSGIPTGANSYSVACFVKADPTSHGNGGWVGWGSTGFDTGTRCINLRMSGYYDAAAYWWNSDQGGHVPSGNFRDGWHSVVQTYDGATRWRTMYIDGQQVSRDQPAAPNVTHERFEVGKTLADANLKGWIDDLLILNRAMTLTEAQYYNTNGARIASASTPYDTWLASYAFASGADQTPTGDPDGDSMTNQQEFAFGLDPTKGSSCNPITVPLNNTAGMFSYTRTANSGLAYTVWTSIDLADWGTVPAQADQVARVPAVDGVETVDVTLNPYTPPPGGKLFVRVKAQ
ncbi:MAG: hypothetical protein NTW21_18720 [Verrucomicrobia bacterium]|nr:hypothetical protein [Verrucomicrobiota bacterium]